VTPLLWELHWLRVPERITFKLASLVLRCLNGTAPVYLADNINRTDVVETRRSLRLHSSSLTAVDVPVTSRSTIGDRAFSVVAVRAWNSPLRLVTSASSLSTFKRHLKTYLFAVSYTDGSDLCSTTASLSLYRTSRFFLCITCPCSFWTKRLFNLLVNNNINNINNNQL